jgi:S1-C subfamily serine protease
MISPPDVSFFRSTELESPITEQALLLVGGDGAATHALGSAVFIATELAMTARHVVEEFWNRLGPGSPFQGEQQLEARFSILAVQYPGVTSEPALWRVTFVWGARFTDIAFVGLVPANSLAEKYRWVSRLKLNLLPPVVGERVVGFGYAASRVEMTEGGRMQLSLNPSTTGGLVTAVFPEYRDRGMLKFPCFEIHAHFIGGMSGGPLFNNAGEVCGLICASRDGEPIAYGATLWPAMGTIITHQGPGMVCKAPYPVFEMAQVGLLNATGWDQVVKRIEIETDPFGVERLRLRPE